ncbi:MAG: hypothetical protein ACKO0Z_06995 [Betaproteobacteria bacterium]
MADLIGSIVKRIRESWEANRDAMNLLEDDHKASARLVVTGSNGKEVVVPLEPSVFQQVDNLLHKNRQAIREEGANKLFGEDEEE